MSADDSSHIFVYGTLMTSASGALGRDMRLRLRREARLVGPATLNGRLYDLGSYPGLVTSADPADIVHGEVLSMVDPAATLIWLDAYEGLGRGPQAVDEYIREIAEPRLVTGNKIEAWVYLFRRPVVGLPRVRSGRWISRG